MTVKFFDVFNKTDWLKIIILVAIAIVSWGWVYREYQKPLFPPGWEMESQGVVNVEEPELP